MPDYKAMYFHLAGRMATAVEALEATTIALATIAEGLRKAQQSAEDIYMNSEDDDLDAEAVRQAQSPERPETTGST